MSEPAICNASPLIYLARTNLLHLLQLAAPEVLVPYLSDQIVATALAEIGE